MPAKSSRSDKKIWFNLSVPALAREAFYFFSAWLGLGALMEIFLPGFFSLYFNAAFLAAAWLACLFLILFYVRR